MKTTHYVGLILAFGVITAVKGQGKIEVTVTEIKESKGNIRVGLFNSDDTFLKDAVNGKVVKATNGQVTVMFENLKSGNYAVSVIHDQNENGDLDKNLIGIPSEGFGFGNNAMGSFGPPSFDEAKVVVQDKQVVRQVIKLRYF